MRNFSGPADGGGGSGQPFGAQIFKSPVNIHGEVLAKGGGRGGEPGVLESRWDFWSSKFILGFPKGGGSARRAANLEFPAETH